MTHILEDLGNHKKGRSTTQNRDRLSSRKWFIT